MRFLMTTDGSRHAEGAVAYGSILANALGADVTLLGVVESPGESEIVEASLTRCQAILQGLEVRKMVRMGHADEEILRESERECYDLVVMGSLGARGLTRFLLGPTVTRVAKYARTSVLIVRGARNAISRVLICTAAPGERAQTKVAFAARIARAVKARATVMHVLDEVPLVDIEDKEMTVLTETLEAATPEAEHLRRCLAILKGKGVEGEAKFRYGLVEDEILAEAEEGGYDLVIIGAHAALGVEKYLLGDVASKVVDHAKVPVLVVRLRVGGS
ncbi:MAG: universal stress protein [Candidatus Hydrothermarchaeota archaeon]